MKNLSIGWLLTGILLCLFSDLSAQEAQPVTVVEDGTLATGSAAALDTDSTETMDELLDLKTIPEEDFSKLPTAVQWHYELAQQGDREAQYNLGTLYETGFGISTDAKKAIFWLTKAADQGHIHAQLKLGLMTILGIGTDASLIKGRKWVQAAADKDNNLAKMLMEKVLSHEAKSLVNVNVLTKKIYTAFGTGEFNAEETLRIAIQRVERERKAEPEKERFSGQLTGSGAKQGSVRNRLPDFLDEDSVDSSTLGRSVSLVRRHAKEGAADAQYELARMLEFGQGILMNKAEAVKWYSAAAQQGYADAQYRFGIACLYGLGIERNTTKAALWLKRASEQQHPAASLLRAQIGDQPGMQSLEVTLALSINLERSLQGDGAAMLALGHMFENGWGVPRDDIKAHKWYAKARAAGVSGATTQLNRIKGTAGPINRGLSGQIQSESVLSPAAKSNTDLVAPPPSISVDSPNISPGTIKRSLSTGSNGLEQPTLGLANSLDGSMQREVVDPLSAEGRAILLERYGMPALLLILGLIMGWAVFRLMRRSESREAH